MDTLITSNHSLDQNDPAAARARQNEIRAQREAEYYAPPISWDCSDRRPD